MRKLSLFVLAALVLGSRASADDHALPNFIGYPGSVNLSAGTLTPSEPGNLIATTTAEQGITAWHSGSAFLVGYTSVSLRSDTQGYTWNNNTPVVVGAKFVKTWTFGVIQAGGGLGLVARTAGPTPAALTASVSYWSGWRNERSTSANGLAFPGHFWVSSGYATPLERGNWITTASAEEGVTLLRRGRIGVVPFGAVTAGADTDHHPWNNKTSIDVGVKAERFVPGGIVEVGTARRHEYQRLTGESHTGMTVFVNFWLGWDPRHVRQ
jgi:hypothetical protein